ncbi:MAG: helix-turn-helix domain-containing protein [Pseudomonadota bacterium]
MPRHHLQVSGQAEPVDRSAPLLRRKQPKQGRSIALVDALKMACRQILAREGAEELTAARLAEVSGVSTGSIYEYFPNLEALVAEVLHETIQHAAVESGSVLSLPENTSLLDLLSHMVHRAFEKRAYLAGLHGHIYLRYMQYFEAIEVDGIQKILERYSDLITLQDKRLAALVVTNALRQFSQTLLYEDPLYVRSPETERMVVRMLHAALVDPEQDQRA